MLASTTHGSTLARGRLAHHEAPAVLEGVLIPAYAVLIFLAMIAVTDWAHSFALALVIGGMRVAWMTSGVVVSFAILTAYEWTHAVERSATARSLHAQG